MFTTLISLLTLANAPVGPVNPRLIIDPCGTGGADASATLGADVDWRELSSNGTAYANKATCKRFVADFNVPSNANPADSHGVLEFDLGGGFANDPGQESACNGTQLLVSTFEKVAGSNGFAKRSSATYQGQWQNGMFSFCNFVKVSGSNPPVDTPNPAGAEVWRVAVSATHNGTARAVEARIAFKIIPW
jgi:hypothetical protein